MEHELGKCPDDEKRKESGDRVEQGENRARGIEPSARAQKQPGADRAADRDHLQLTLLQRFAVSLVLGRQGGRRR